MSSLTILRSYAQKSNPDSLPSSVLLSHSDTSLTIFDAYPKSIFHFLILPRVKAPWTANELTGLSSVFKCDKARAKELLLSLKDEADSARKTIQDEMQKRYGFKWDIWIGFHAIPSMEHLHLHVISNDLCSPRMKLKKHYNSFHPKLGFFLHLNDVLSWFDAEPSYFETAIQLKKAKYEPLLKEPLSCWRCGRDIANMPTLKSHLQVEWDDEARKEKARVERKRKREEDANRIDTQNTLIGPPTKK
ncbi:HIT-like domain-containing protein [Hygrophoropsis aurantiaca]|uniref:HIT-like domain-containing protein n=1 Tax=Hygrophoropsis aurantiaca TaxID=72124 RepID=A0ACB8ANZ2_9AGAM|nr:HIT-like domain-containing protein [Hygrophoropsis aurantiaca]